MTKSTDGPIVDDVRRVRRQIVKECGYDLHRYAEFLRQKEKTSGLRFGTPRRRRAKTK